MSKLEETESEKLIYTKENFWDIQNLAFSLEAEINDCRTEIGELNTKIECYKDMLDRVKRHIDSIKNQNKERSNE